MKIVLLVGILFLFFANIWAEKTITCKVSDNNPSVCIFSDETIGENDTVSVTTNPTDADVNSITSVEFRSSSSIYSIPRQIFQKFPNLENFYAAQKDIKEIKPNTFVDAKKLEKINLWGNELTVLHADAFKGKIFNFIFFGSKLLQ
jgi:hypothetical protein